jgi:hypothetical protein
MLIRIVALFVILVGATVAWGILGTTLLVRTQQADETQRIQLGSLWGPSLSQAAPEFGHPTKTGPRPIPIDASRVTVNLLLDQRRKGLLWYNTYRVDFAGSYRVVNTTRGNWLTFALRFPADKGVYDDVRVLVGGRPVAVSTFGGVITVPLIVTPGGSRDVTVSYSSRGLGQWQYQFGSGINAVRNFDLVMHTSFDAIDFPPDTLAPTDERQTHNGWELHWRYRNLVAGSGIGMLFPERLQPGPLAQRITFWAPLSLLFYFFVLFIITVIRRIDLHPMNFFFLAASFFSFHLLFAYTVDRIEIWIAFLVCAVVSMLLTVSYLRIVAGLRFAAVEAGLAQFFYLILFSLALFNEGFSGLAITIGSIITLFVTMQLTARINWSERFAANPGK